MKKYTLEKENDLYRLIAAINIPSIGVQVGDRGGLVAGTHNLSHDGNAWVSENAWVYGNAWVSENAQVYGNAQVPSNLSSTTE